MEGNNCNQPKPGQLDVSKVLKNTALDFCVPSGVSDVLVKVSSITVHHLLFKPAHAINALKMIKQSGKKELIDEIGSVLYAIVFRGPSLVTIMSDLRKEGYAPLKPIDNTGQLDVFWDGFQDLVVRMLLPMAELGIVHAGIRPSIDVTSNVIAKLDRFEGKITKATLRLIDFESLVEIAIWDPAEVDGRYITEGS